MRPTQFKPRLPENAFRSGFTLVELLVVIGILIILTAMTLSMVNLTQDEDRVRAGAAQVQSYLEGARDRAIHAKEPRGVRFLFDTDNNNLATSMIYIGAPGVIGEGQSARIRGFGTFDSQTGEWSKYYVEAASTTGPDWNNLFARQLVSNGSPIQIEGQFYTIVQMFNTKENRNVFQLTKPYKGTKFDGLNFRLFLNPTVLPNQEPRQLPRGVVIDLCQSLLPDPWGTCGGYNTLDVLFSPNGTVTGLVASAGVIHFVVADQVDVDRGFHVGVDTFDPDLSTGPEPALKREGNQRVVSLRTQTGGISVHNVDPTDTDTTDSSNNTADDPFSYAAKGEPAK